MTNCLEGIFAFLKIPFIPKGKRVASEGKIYICIYIYTHARTRKHTYTYTNTFFFLPKTQLLRNSFSFTGGTRLQQVECVFFCHGGFELGKGAVGGCRRQEPGQELPGGCRFIAPTTSPPSARTHHRRQIGSCSLRGMLMSGRQGIEKPQGWIKDEARRGTRRFGLLLPPGTGSSQNELFL